MFFRLFRAAVTGLAQRLQICWVEHTRTVIADRNDVVNDGRHSGPAGRVAKHAKRLP
jgi:hypothetical protein